MGKYLIAGIGSFTLALALLTTAPFAHGQDKPPVVGWEYKMLRVRQIEMESAVRLGEQAVSITAKLNSDALEKFQSELTEAGNQGWELVSVVATPDELSASSRNTALKAFLKRRL